jgi:hypothetical protein
VDERALLRLRCSIEGEASSLAIHADRLEWSIPVGSIQAVTVRRRRGRVVVAVRAYGNVVRLRATSSQAQEVKLLLQALAAGRHPAQSSRYAAPQAPDSALDGAPDALVIGRRSWRRRLWARASTLDRAPR